MNFLSCDAQWVLGPGGELTCPGILSNFTTEQMQSAFNSGLTLEESNQLVWLTAGLFAAVFVVLVIKKVL